MPRVQKSSSPLKLPGGGLRAPCRSFSLHLLVGPCHSEEKWIRHGCLSNRAHLFSLSLSLSARALLARELSFVLLETRSGFPKPKTEIQSLGEDRRGRQEVGEAQALVVVLVGHEHITHPFKHHHPIIIIIIMGNHWTQLSSDRSARDPRQQRSGPGTYFVPSEAEEVQTANAKLSDLGSPSVHTPLQNQF